MIAGRPGTCSCCGRPFPAGEEITRTVTGWARAACLRRAPPTAPGGAAEVLEILARARVVAARVEAEARARAGSLL